MWILHRSIISNGEKQKQLPVAIDIFVVIVVIVESSRVESCWICLVYLFLKPAQPNPAHLSQMVVEGSRSSRFLFHVDFVGWFCINFFY